MIVLDASVVVELLIGGPLADRLREDLTPRGDVFLVPHLLDVEVVNALRKLAASQRIDAHRCQQALGGLAMLPAERIPHGLLFGRIWELRHNFTAYDATYIALAEETNATLYTSDEKLARGHRATVRLFTE
jgi:predicted nucleic acid-binding protein